MNIYSIRDETGTIVQSVPIWPVITERKQAEEELRSGEAPLQAVFDALPIWVAVRDKESHYAMVNRQWLLETNYESNEFVSCRKLDRPRFPAAELEQEVRADWQVLESGLQLAIPGYSATLPRGRKGIFSSHRVPLRPFPSLHSTPRFPQ